MFGDRRRRADREAADLLRGRRGSARAASATSSARRRCCRSRSSRRRPAAARRRRCRERAGRGRRCGTRCGSGDGTARCARDSARAAAARSSSVSSQPASASCVALSGRGRAGRRHHAGAQLADHLLPFRRRRGHVCDAQRVERDRHDAAALHRLAVTGDAITIEDRLMRGRWGRWRGGRHGLRHSGGNRRCRRSSWRRRGLLSRRLFSRRRVADDEQAHAYPGHHQSRQPHPGAGTRTADESRSNGHAAAIRSYAVCSLEATA